MRTRLSTVWKGLNPQGFLNQQVSKIFSAVENYSKRHDRPMRAGAGQHRPHPEPLEPDQVAAFMAGQGDPNARDAYGFTPLMAAACWHGPELVEALLRAGADVNAAYQHNGFTPLILSVLRGDPAVVDAVLAGRPNLQAKWFGGETALQLAITSEGDRAIPDRIVREARRQSGTTEAGSFQKMKPIVFAKKPALS